MKNWRKRIFWLAWITYASFYFTRANISIAIPGIMEEYGISKTEIGEILTISSLFYAGGQFINGQLGDKFGPKKIISLGLIGSGILNIIFGFSSGILILMMLIWALNSYFQSMGWPSIVKTIANWFPSKIRGRASGVLGSSYQIGNAVSWVLAGFVIGVLGWRWGFWIPGIIVIVSAIHWFIRIRNAPKEVELSIMKEEENAKTRKDNPSGFKYSIEEILKNPKIWIVALSFFSLSILTQGFMVWIPTYMVEIQKATISTAAYKAITIPVAGSLGSIFVVWVSDKFFKSERTAITVTMLLLLAVFTWLYPKIPAGNWILGLSILILIGFMINGPQILMVATIPMDYGTRKVTASYVGFIDGFGKIGVALGAVASGWLIDNFSWNAAFNFWVVSSITAAILMMILWCVQA